MITKINIKNVKSTSVGDYDIQKLNLLLGENGSGKSTILDSIAITMDGKHPHNGNRLEDIMNICPGDNLEVSLNVEKDENSAIFKRTFNTDEKGSNSQSIIINNRKVKKAEGENTINNWFGEFLPRVDISKFIDLSAKEKAKFLFKLFGDKLNNLTPSDIEHEILYSIIRTESDFQGEMTFKLNKVEGELNDSEKLELFNSTIDKMKERPWVLRNYNIVRDSISSVNKDMDIQSYISEVIEVLRRTGNDMHASVINKKGTVKELQGRVNFDIEIDEVKKDKKLASKRIKEITDKVTAFDEYKRAQESYATTLSNLNDRFNEELPVDTSDINALIKKVKLEKEKLEATKDSSLKIIKYRENNDLVEKNRVKIVDLKNKVAKRSVKIDKLTTKINEYDDTLKDIASTIERGKINQSRLREKVREVNKKVASIENKEKCPLCTQDISSKAIIDSFNKDISKYDASIKKSKDKESLANKQQKAIVEKRTAIFNDFRELGFDNKNDTNNILALSDEIEGLDIIKYDADTTTISIDDLTSKINKKCEELTELDKQALAIDNNAKIKEAIDSINAPDKVDDPGDLTDEVKLLKKSIEASDRLIEVAAENEGLFKTIEDLQQEVVALTTSWQYIKKAMNHSTDIKVHLITSMLGAVEKRTNSILSNSLENAKAIITPEFCGLYQDGIDKDISVLSGGEAVLFSSALLAALMIESNVNEKILLLEGGELDNNNLHLLMDSLVNIDIDNVFIATFHRDGKKFNPAWNVIEL